MGLFTPSQVERELKERVEQYKPLWDKNGVIQFKNNNVAILKRSLGQQVEFIIAFDDLTKEGFELKVVDEGKSGGANGLTGGINSFYYFQKL